MAKKQRKYDMEYKIQAVKLAKELGGGGTAGCWLRLAHATDGNEPRRGIVNPAQTGQRAGKRNTPPERRK